jgi:hypothetical protein
MRAPSTPFGSAGRGSRVAAGEAASAGKIGELVLDAGHPLRQMYHERLLRRREQPSQPTRTRLLSKQRSHTATANFICAAKDYSLNEAALSFAAIHSNFCWNAQSMLTKSSMGHLKTSKWEAG